MTELRAPDPTLSDLNQRAPGCILSLDYAHGEPPLAHLSRWFPDGRWYEPVCADLGCEGYETAPPSYARWFAVPCRVCFPHAPKHGCRAYQPHEVIPKAPELVVLPDEYLSWQVPS